jgi:uncharacterized protein
LSRLKYYLWWTDIQGAFMRLIQYIAVFLSLATVANAQDLPGPLTPYISDYANLIDPETEARISNRLTELRRELDLELAVVTIETRFDYGNADSIETFATELFNTWGIGNATRNDGALILVARSDREMRIEVGKSYGPIFDDRMALVIEHHFLPYFKGDQYAEGIEAGTYETIKRLQPTYDITDPTTLENPSLLTTLKRTSFWRFIEDKLPILVFLGIVAFLYFENRMRDMLVGLKRCPNCNRRQLQRKRTIEREATKTTRGKELLETTCSGCEFESEEHRIIPMYTTTSSSGSSSFGGGSSSGGGASGRW